MSAGLRRSCDALLAVAALAAAVASSGCDDAGGERRVRVTFAVRAPDPLSALVAEVTYPGGWALARKASGKPACVRAGDLEGSWSEPAPGLLYVDLHSGASPGPSGRDDLDAGGRDGAEDDCYALRSDDDPDDERGQGPTSEARDEDRGRLLDAAVTTRPMFACSFHAGGGAGVADFTIRVADASAEGVTVTSSVDLFVDEVFDESSTTSTSSTSTTRQDSDSAPRPYRVVVGVTAVAGHLGALQFDIVSEASGGFSGAGAAVRCVALVDAIASFNDRGNGTVSVGLITLTGFSTPSEVAACTFRTREEPKPADFRVVLLDAADPQGGRPRDCPRMAVTRLEPLF